jgi:hypothetical protein
MLSRDGEWRCVSQKEGTHTKNKRGGRAKQQESKGLEVSVCLKTVGYLEGLNIEQKTRMDTESSEEGVGPTAELIVMEWSRQ